MPDLIVVLLLATPLLAGLACALPGFEQEAEPLSMASAALLIGFSLLLAARTAGSPGSPATIAAASIGAGPLTVDALGTLLVLIIAGMGAVALLSMRDLAPSGRGSY